MDLCYLVVVQAVLDLSLAPAPLAAHVTALHHLTCQGAGGAGGSAGGPKQWCARVYAACHEALARVVDARGHAVSEGVAATHPHTLSSF